MNKQTHTKLGTLIIPLLLIVIAAQAQSDTLGVKYNANFVFKSGLYRTITDFKNNNPVDSIQGLGFEAWKEQMKNRLEWNSTHFYHWQTKDSLGKRTRIYVDSIWGCSYNNNIYRSDVWKSNYGRRMAFVRLGIIGAICYSGSVQSSNPTDIQDKKLGEEVPIGFLLDINHSSIGAGVFVDRTGAPSRLKNPEFLDVLTSTIDFETGREFNFEKKEIEAILVKDGELFELYRDEKVNGKKDKEIKLWKYAKWYNRRNPIYFPN